MGLRFRIWPPERSSSSFASALIIWSILSQPLEALSKLPSTLLPTSAVQGDCPSGWEQLGDVGDDVPGCGITGCLHTDTIDDCKVSCDGNPRCASFEFQPSTSLCALNKPWKATTSQQIATWEGSVTCKKTKVGGKLPRADGDWASWAEDAAQSRAKIRLPKDNGTMYFYVHVPKVGGASFINDSLRKYPGYLPSSAGFIGREACYDEMTDLSEMAERAGVNSRIVTFLRSPRDHVISMYHECKDSPWGSKNFNVPDMLGWLQHFAGAPTADDFGCYNPQNMQTRAFTCEDDLHHVKLGATASQTAGLDLVTVSEMQSDDRENSNSFEHEGRNEIQTGTQTTLAQTLDFGQGRKFLWGLQEGGDKIQEANSYGAGLQKALGALESGVEFVGLTEYYHESLCLFAESASGELPSGCDRNKPKAWEHFVHSDVTHGVAYDKKDLPAEESSLVEQLTRDDRVLYDAALEKFMRRARHIEDFYGIRLMPSPSEVPFSGVPVNPIPGRIMLDESADWPASQPASQPAWPPSQSLSPSASRPSPMQRPPGGPLTDAE